MSYRRSIRAYASALGIVALLAWPGLRAQQLRPSRIVAIGDIHGDYKAFKEILEGKHDQVPEGNFYMKGGIEEIAQS